MAGSVIGVVIGSGSVVGVGMTLAIACASCMDDATSVPFPVPFLVLGRRRLLVEPFAMLSYVGTDAGAAVGTVDVFTLGAVGGLGPTLGGVADAFWDAASFVQVVGAGGVVGAGVGTVVGYWDGPLTGSTLGPVPAGFRCTSVCTLGAAPPGEPCGTPVGNP
jgi:hypothetical protein